MSTVGKSFADNIAANGGWYNGDSDNSLGDNPQTVRIVEYDNAWGGKGYGLVFAGQRNKYEPSDYVRNPRTYWEFKE